MIVLGGSCEPLSAFRQLNIKTFPGPFDWLGVPTAIFPQLVQINWWEDLFSLDNIATYSAREDKCIGVRDLKYQVTSLHHFKRYGMKNFSNLIAEQLPKFRAELKKRWFALKEALKQESLVVYREFIPVWGKPEWANTLNSAYEALLEFAPKSKIIIVTENNCCFDKAVVIKQKSLDAEYFKVNEHYWHPAWKMAMQDLECGKVYNPYSA